MSQHTELILLRWFDSAVAPATEVYTTEQGKQEKPVALETIGWLVAETGEPYGGAYIIASSQHGMDWRGVQLIPKVNVISLRRFLESEIQVVDAILEKITNRSRG